MNGNNCINALYIGLSSLHIIKTYEDFCDTLQKCINALYIGLSSLHMF